MLKSIKIKKFQSHENTLLKFSSGVNIIFGKSQAGKTAIFRAFKWLVTNRPLGVSFKSKFSSSKDSTVVQLKTGRNNIITLKKSDKDSKYILKTKSGKKTFRKFKGKIPDEIENALNLNFGLTFQNQLNPHSVSSSPTDLGKRIDDVIGTFNLEKWMGIASKRLSGKKRELVIVKSRIEKNEENLKNYDGLSDLQNEINLCNSLETKIVDVESKIDRLTSLLESYKEIKGRINHLTHYSDLIDDIDRFETDRSRFGELAELIASLKNYVETVFIISELKEKIENLKTEYIKRLSVKKICPLCFSSLGRANLKKIKSELRR